MARQGWGRAKWPARVLQGCAVGAIAGCASPGAPHPPSLQLPAQVQNLTAERVGDDLDLRFTVPSRTTDGVPLRELPLTATLCRVEHPGAACGAVPAAEIEGPSSLGRPGATVHWTDHLPGPLRSGPQRPIGLRLQLRNAAGRTAGYSSAVYAVAGAAPPPVEGLRVTGTRRGPLLQWQPIAGAGEVLLQRTEDSAVPTTHAQPRQGEGKAGGERPATPGKGAQRTPSGTVWLQAAPGATGAGETIDGSAAAGVPYHYRALRQLVVVEGGHSLEVRSTPSAPVATQWEPIYPPAAPRQLTAAAYVSPAEAGSPARFAVDLIWEPPDDPDIAGYLVTRTDVTPQGGAAAAPERLTRTPVVAPAFHDDSGAADRAYRYEVRAVDSRGNLSPPAVTDVAPQPR